MPVRCERMIVKPYIGEFYRRKMPLGLTIMIVGESSYDGRRGERLPEDWNDRIVRSFHDYPCDLFLKRALDVFFDVPPIFSEQIAFLETIAFANLVQTDMGAPGQRPRTPDWIEAQAAFEYYLIQFRPQFVLVVGRDLWRSLPSKHRTEHTSVRIGNDEMPAYLYPNDAGYAFVFGMKHTSRSWRHRDLRPWAKAAVESALRFHNLQQT